MTEILQIDDWPIRAIEYLIIILISGSMKYSDDKTDVWEPEKGSLYRVNKDKSVSKQLSKITLSNGLVWSPDKKKFYFIDTMKYRVDSYDYDNATGNICKYIQFFRLIELEYTLLMIQKLKYTVYIFVLV